VTEIYDYLRLLYARVGVAHCPRCNTKIKPQSAENISKQILSDIGSKIMILSPIIKGQKGTHEKVFEKLIKEGFVRVRVNGEIHKLENVKDEVKLARYEKHWIEAVVDRITVSDDERERISQSVEQALNFGGGSLIVLDVDKEKDFRQKYLK